MIDTIELLQLKLMTEKGQRVVMAFGVFDIVHDGHRHFLKCAKKLGGYLVAVVAPDVSVQSLKKSAPQHPLFKRIKNLAGEKLADEIIPGDEILGSWKIFSRVLPDIIALGYDQEQLHQSLVAFINSKKLPIECVFIPSHNDKTLHSSELRKKM